MRIGSRDRLLSRGRVVDLPPHRHEAPGLVRDYAGRLLWDGRSVWPLPHAPIAPAIEGDDLSAKVAIGPGAEWLCSCEAVIGLDETGVWEDTGKIGAPRRSWFG
jgi:hypothetical protein